ncbi:hypothetical protein [Streptomyces sp. NPDC058613]|uniref:hypothetical protein n=1 Tax=unclassified Streptomyces TaxID=2593676 RepID=UPI0036592F2D
MIAMRYRTAAAGLLTAALVVLPVTQATALPPQAARATTVTIDCGGFVITVTIPVECRTDACRADFIARIERLCSRP